MPPCLYETFKPIEKDFFHKDLQNITRNNPHKILEGTVTESQLATKYFT